MITFWSNWRASSQPSFFLHWLFLLFLVTLPLPFLFPKRCLALVLLPLKAHLLSLVLYSLPKLSHCCSLQKKSCPSLPAVFISWYPISILKWIWEWETLPNHFSLLFSLSIQYGCVDGTIVSLRPAALELISLLYPEIDKSGLQHFLVLSFPVYADIKSHICSPDIFYILVLYTCWSSFLLLAGFSALGFIFFSPMLLWSLCLAPYTCYILLLVLPTQTFTIYFFLSSALPFLFSFLIFYHNLIDWM